MRYPLMIEVNVLDCGGAEHFVVQLIKHLNRQRFTPHLVCTFQFDSTQKSPDRWHYLQQLRSTDPGLNVDFIDPKLTPEQKTAAYLRLLRRYRIRVVYQFYSNTGSTAAAEAGVPVVVWLGNSLIWMDREGRAWMRHHDRRVTVRYVACSENVRRWSITRLGLPPAKFAVIPNPVDLAEVRGRRWTRTWDDPNPAELPGAPAQRAADSSRPGLRRRLGLAAADHVFLNLAAFSFYKGHSVLLAAMRRLRDHPRIRALCVGPVRSPDLWHMCQDRVQQWGLADRVILVPRWESDTASLFAMADAFLLPSIEEGWSLAMTEAIAWGLPLVLSDAGGAREALAATGSGILVPNVVEDGIFLNDENCWRFAYMEDPPNAAALAEAMLQMYEERGRWRRAAQRAAPRAANYDTPRIVAQHERVLEAAAAARV